MEGEENDRPAEPVAMKEQPIWMQQSTVEGAVSEPVIPEVKLLFFITPAFIRQKNQMWFSYIGIFVSSNEQGRLLLKIMERI